MSPRAACGLMPRGFAPVYDYTLGRVDWIAAGLPTVRAAQPSRRVLDAVRRDVPTCAPGAPAGLAMQQARAQGWDRCMVIAGHRAPWVGSCEPTGSAPPSRPGCRGDAARPDH